MEYWKLYTVRQTYSKISKASSDIYLIKTFLYSNTTAMQKMSNESNKLCKICK